MFTVESETLFIADIKLLLYSITSLSLPQTSVLHGTH